MAKRQQVESSPQWPSVATRASLPNVAGSPTQSVQLDVGDICYVTGVNATFRCTSATLGAATWTLTYQNAVIVQNEADFPAAVAGVITLVANTTYFLFGTVTLTAGNRISMPPSAALIGSAAPISKLVGNVNAALVTVEDPAATTVGHIYFCTLQNTNAGAAAYALTSNQPAGTLNVLDSILTSAGAFGYVVGTVVSTSLRSTSVSGQGGVKISAGVSYLLLQDSSFAPTAAAGAAVDVVAGAAVSVITVIDSAFVSTAGTQFGLRVDVAATVASAEMLRALQLGPGTFNSGWTQATIGYHVRDCPSLQDSVAGGGASLTTQPSTVTTGAQNVWQDISTGAAIYGLNSGSERFTLNNANNGELKYIGGRSRKMLVTGNVSVAMSSGGANGLRIGMWKNGSLLAETIAEATAQINRGVSIMTCSILSDVVTNDTFVLRVMNLDSTTSMIFQAVGVSATALGA